MILKIEGGRSGGPTSNRGSAPMSGGPAVKNEFQLFSDSEKHISMGFSCVYCIFLSHFVLNYMKSEDT